MMEVDRLLSSFCIFLHSWVIANSTSPLVLVGDPDCEGKSRRMLFEIFLVHIEITKSYRGISDFLYNSTEIRFLYILRECEEFE